MVKNLGQREQASKTHSPIFGFDIDDNHTEDRDRESEQLGDSQVHSVYTEDDHDFLSTQKSTMTLMCWIAERKLPDHTKERDWSSTNGKNINHAA